MNDKTQKTFLIVNVILIFAAMVLELFQAGSATGWGLAASLILIFALASAAVYFFYGAKKNAAEYYRICVYIFAIPQLIRVGEAANCGLPVFAILSALAFGAICILAEAKDYGKVKSLVLGLIVLIVNIILMIVDLATVRLSGLSCIVDTVISIILLLMILAKYTDKQSRGSK